MSNTHTANAFSPAPAAAGANTLRQMEEAGRDLNEWVEGRLEWRHEHHGPVSSVNFSGTLDELINDLWRYEPECDCCLPRFCGHKNIGDWWTEVRYYPEDLQYRVLRRPNTATQMVMAARDAENANLAIEAALMAYSTFNDVDIPAIASAMRAWLTPDSGERTGLDELFAALPKSLSLRANNCQIQLETSCGDKITLKKNMNNDLFVVVQFNEPTEWRHREIRVGHGSALHWTVRYGG